MPVRAIKNSNGDWVVTDGDKTYGNHGKDEKKAHRQARAINMSLKKKGKI